MIYVIHCDGYCKIGQSDAPEKRFATLQTGSPHKMSLMLTLPGGYAEEQRLHARFAERRVRGEWFLLSIEDIREMALMHVPQAMPELRRPAPGDHLAEETDDDGSISLDDDWVPVDLG